DLDTRTLPFFKLVKQKKSLASIPYFSHFPHPEFHFVITADFSLTVGLLQFLIRLSLSFNLKSLAADMGKPLNGWSLSHVLAFSVVLNVSLVLRLAYNERESVWRSENDVVCTKARVCSAVSSSLSPSYAASAAAQGIASEDEDEGRIVNLDQGDPTMYERFWQMAGDKASILIPGWQAMSYFSDPSNVCWFLEPGLAKEIVRLHGVVGNAVTNDRHIVVGTGSTQLFQAALYALSPSEATQPISVVSATPYYSFYKQVINYLKSGLYKWAGDVSNIKDDEPYIELVTSPNNPDGFMRQPVLDRTGGFLIHDFAYYWPQYTPITHPADHDIMLFTVSKSTGHAGMRIGWALVKDKEVAKKMVKFIELSSIGVSKDSQLRAAKILHAVSNTEDDFFEFNFQLMESRWKQLREVVKKSGLFSLPDFPSAFCKYSNRSFKTQPAFAWLKCEGDVKDCEEFLRGEKILTRSGTHFGVSPKFVRLSMLDRDSNFKLFLRRLSKIHQ
ncbi:hypothetical protein V2J09_006814, partial [Rumex salicifolius]